MYLISHLIQSAAEELAYMCYLCSYVGILFPVAVTVVGVEIVGPHHAVHGLQHHPAVVVGNHVGISME